MSNGNLISDGKNTYSVDCGTYPMPPLLYTQAQVDALVQAERERCAKIADKYRDKCHERGPSWDDQAMAAGSISARIRGDK